MGLQSMAKRFDQAVQHLGARVAGVLAGIPEEIKARAGEVRLRAGQPVVLGCPDMDYFVNHTGGVTSIYRDGLVSLTVQEIGQAFASLCDYSVHSFQSEICHGFVTIKGGHRAGICGTAVLEKGQIVSIRDISSINLRVAREHAGAADLLIRRIFSQKMEGLLLAGPPACGKTTVLRDLARQLSSGATGRYCRVAVVDERGEIAGVFRGMAQNNLGPCCDCLNDYPKAAGISQAIRCLSPDVILCDELADKDEIRAVHDSVNAGVKIVTTMHAGSFEELSMRVQAKELLQTGAFGYIAMMKGRESPGEITGILKAGELFENSWTSSRCADRNDGGFFEIQRIQKPRSTA